MDPIRISLELPPGYYLERDSCNLVLRRLDHSIVTAFSTPDAEIKKVQRAAEEDSYPEIVYRQSAPVRYGTEQSYLQVRYFDHFELFCGSEIVSLGCNRKTIAIIKYMLANRGRPVSRDYLMGWLWPESNLSRARSSLNSAMHALRKILGDLPPFVSVPECILLKKDNYQLWPSVPVERDVDEFDAAYERGLRLEKAGLSLEAAAQYEEAIGRYQGDYLVEDLYEDWTMIERERLIDAYLDMLRQLASYYITSGRLQECKSVCYQFLEKDPCDEDSHLLLVKCHKLLGSYGRASRQYRLFQDTLRSAYGTKPSVEAQGRFKTVLEM